MNTFLDIDNDSKQIRMEKIAGMTGIDPELIYEIYPYGSRVYGTHSDRSDHDYILVYYGHHTKDGQQFDSRDGRYSVHTYSMKHWLENCNLHKIFTLECNFLDGPYNKLKFDIDKSILRSEISAKASNSWVKCKKKLEIENDYYIGIKSLFHSFRIPIFGLQIAKYGKIVDYSEANPYWFDEFRPMLSQRPTWTEIKEIYQPRHNKLMTEFRKHAEL